MAQPREQPREQPPEPSREAAAGPSSMSAAALSAWTATPTALQLDAQFCFPIYAAAHVVMRAYRPLLAPLGLTYPQYLVMLVLWEEQSITVKALGARLHLDSGTLSPLLARLAARRLVKKQRHKDDARKVTVALTPKGLALRADAARVPEALMCHLLAGRGDVDVDAAAVAMRATREQLRALVRAVDAAADVDADTDLQRP